MWVDLAGPNPRLQSLRKMKFQISCEKAVMLWHIDSHCTDLDLKPDNSSVLGLINNRVPYDGFINRICPIFEEKFISS